MKDERNNITIIKKNTTLNGVSTFTIKTAIRTVILGLKGLLKLVESYEKGEITEDQCLDRGEQIAKKLDAEFNKPELKALNIDFTDEEYLHNN